MFDYEYDYERENMDSCDVFENQRAYIIALGFTNASMKFGK